MQLQWLRYVSICRPVERHQFIIIALNRPAPCTPTPSHSILPSIVQFRFYAVIALFSHRLRHFSSLLPPPLFRFKRSNFRFLALLLFSLFSFLSFFFYLSLPFYAIYPRCPTLFITRQHFYISRYTFYERKSSSPPFCFPLPRSPLPRIVPPSIIIPSPPPPPPRDSASPVLFSSTFRRSRIHTLKWTSKSGRGGIKKVFTACSDPSPPPARLTLSRRFNGSWLVARRRAKGKRGRRQRGGRLAIAICAERTREDGVYGGSGRTNNGKNGAARRNGRSEVGRASVGGKRWRRRGREVAAERQRQNATNSKRAEPCACIRNAIGPLSTGARPPPFVSRGGQGGGGWGERAELPPEPVAGKF